MTAVIISTFLLVVFPGFGCQRFWFCAGNLCAFLLFSFTRRPLSAASVRMGGFLSILLRFTCGFFFAFLRNLRGNQVGQVPLIFFRLRLLWGLRSVNKNVGERFSLRRATARYLRNVLGLVGEQRILRFPVDFYFYALPQQVHHCDGTVAVRSFNKRSHLGNMLYQVLVGLLLIAETAHQSAAGPGNLYRIERHGLHFCHFCADRLKVVQKVVTAERASADSQSTQHLCFVSHANLPKLDSCAKYRRQILDKLTEINAPICRKIKDDLNEYFFFYLLQLKFSM